MHHPDICDIILIIEDYFLVSTDAVSNCQVQSIVDESDEYQPQRGIKISRKLLNGYIHAAIWDSNRDDDTVTFYYSKELNSSDYLESIEIECCDYSDDNVRSAVRNILTIDKKSVKSKPTPIAV